MMFVVRSTLDRKYFNSIEGETRVDDPRYARKFSNPADAYLWAEGRKTFGFEVVPYTEPSE